jgi:hypothetical protein
MDEILFRALADRVGRYLDGVDRLAAVQPREAGRELRRLAGAWRSLLGHHTLVGTRKRRCRGCRGSPGMCAVWRVAGVWFARG